MNTKTFTILSAIALMSFANGMTSTNFSKMAMAQTSRNMESSQSMPGNNPEAPDMPRITEEDIRQGWQNTKEAVTGAAEDTYETIRAFFVDGQSMTTETPYITVDSRMTAKGMLDRAVYNTANETVGNVDDIILNEQGEAELVVIGQGGFLGMGSKKAAFDYSMVMRRNESGDMIMPITREDIESAMPFSYDRADAGTDENVRVIEQGRMRVSELLGTQVTNNRGENVARTDNIFFRNGKADRVILDLDNAFSLQDDLAAVDYNELQVLQPQEGNYQFRMSAALSEKFEALRKTAMN